MAKRLADFIAEARARIREVSPERLDELMRERPDLLLVDVREADEFAAARLPGARLIPRGTLEGAADPDYRHRDPQLCEARHRPVVLYCQTGARSALAVDTLNQMGFKEAYNLAGGIELWAAEDLPVVR